MHILRYNLKYKYNANYFSLENIIVLS